MVDVKIAILGVGAIGGIVAASLASLKNVELLLHSRSEQGMALMTLGLEVGGIGSGMHIPPTRWQVRQDGEPVPIGWENSAEVAIICSKSASTVGLASAAFELLSADGLVLSLQNGVGNEAKLAEICGRNRTLGALTTHGATRVGLGRVHWAGRGEVVLGVMPGSTLDENSENVQSLVQIFERAELNPRWSADIESELWVKLLLNCAINPLAAICGVKNGALLEVAELHEQAAATMLEAAVIGRAVGAAIPDDGDLIDTLDMVLAATAENDCSMLQDVRSGRLTEIEAITGQVIRLAEQVGIACPLNLQQLALIRGIEAGLRHS